MLAHSIPEELHRTVAELFITKLNQFDSNNCFDSMGGIHITILGASVSGIDELDRDKTLFAKYPDLKERLVMTFPKAVDWMNIAIAYLSKSQDMDFQRRLALDVICRTISIFRSTMGVVPLALDEERAHDSLLTLWLSCKATAVADCCLISEVFVDARDFFLEVNGSGFLQHVLCVADNAGYSPDIVMTLALGRLRRTLPPLTKGTFHAANAQLVVLDCLLSDTAPAFNEKLCYTVAAFGNQQGVTLVCEALSSALMSSENDGDAKDTFINLSFGVLSHFLQSNYSVTAVAAALDAHLLPSISLAVGGAYLIGHGKNAAACIVKVLHRFFLVPSIVERCRKILDRDELDGLGLQGDREEDWRLFHGYIMRKTEMFMEQFEEQFKFAEHSKSRLEETVECDAVSSQLYREVL